MIIGFLFVKLFVMIITQNLVDTELRHHIERFEANDELDKLPIFTKIHAISYCIDDRKWDVEVIVTGEVQETFCCCFLRNKVRKFEFSVLKLSVIGSNPLCQFRKESNYTILYQLASLRSPLLLQ